MRQNYQNVISMEARRYASAHTCANHIDSSSLREHYVQMLLFLLLSAHASTTDFAHGACQKYFSGWKRAKTHSWDIQWMKTRAKWIAKIRSSDILVQNNKEKFKRKCISMYFWWTERNMLLFRLNGFALDWFYGKNAWTVEELSESKINSRYITVFKGFNCSLRTTAKICCVQFQYTPVSHLQEP